MTPAVPLPRRRRIPIKLAQLEEHVRVLARNAQAAAKLSMTVALRLDDLVKELELNEGRELVENRELVRVQPIAPTSTPAPAATPSILNWQENAERLAEIPPVHPEAVQHVRDLERVIESSPAKLARAERAILNVLANRSPSTISDRELSLVAVYSRKSSSYDNALSALRSEGYMDGSPDMRRATREGVIANGPLLPLRTPAELRDAWKAKLSTKAPRVVLDAIHAAQVEGRTLTREELADATGYSMASSSFDNALSELRSLEIIDRRALRLASVLVDAGDES